MRGSPLRRRKGEQGGWELEVGGLRTGNELELPPHTTTTAPLLIVVGDRREEEEMTDWGMAGEEHNHASFWEVPQASWAREKSARKPGCLGTGPIGWVICSV